MAETNPYRNAFGLWAQVASGRRARLVRITSRDEGNRYTAQPIEFDSEGDTQTVGSATLTVTNLAEPAGGGAGLPADADALAVDAGGQWVVFLRPSALATFPAEVISSQGDAAYTVREQVATGAGTFADAPGADDVTAHNLAELSLGPGAAVDDGTIVIVHAVADNGSPTTTRYLFDHPAYAKYLD